MPSCTGWAASTAPTRPRDAFEAARAAGFANINLDFMFGLPDQDPADLARTLARALRLAPGAPLALQPDRGARHAAGRLGAPRQSRRARRRPGRRSVRLACDALAAGGYAQYEISNWARTSINGRRTTIPPIRVRPSPLVCRHNLVYWRNEPYLGFGAGAHSFAEERRWWNVSRCRSTSGASQTGGRRTRG